MIKIVFDLEATCEDKNKIKYFDNEIIEIGAVKVVDGKIVDEYQSFVKPKNSKITEFCKDLTKISQSDVDNARGFAEVIEEFKNWCEGGQLLSWGFYDKKQLEKDCNRYNLDSSWLINHRSLKHEHQTIKKLKRPVGVQKALSLENLTFEGTHHRGIDDVKNIAKIYLKVFKD